MTVENAAARLAPALSDSPWRFLKPLSGHRARDRALLELTRKDELAALDDIVTASRVSLLYAFSGNGKTSLIDAGLIPRLRERGLLIFRSRPRPPGAQNDPSVAIRRGILGSFQFPGVESQILRDLDEARSSANLAGWSPNDLRGLLTRASEALRSPATESDVIADLEGKFHLPLPGFVREVRQALGAERRRIVLICDQFEELFVHYGNTPKMTRFVEEIGALWADDSMDLHILFSMREDWVGSMIEFRRVIPEVFAYYYKLSPLTRSRARLALIKPLENLQVPFEEELVDRVLDDLVLSYADVQRDRFSEVSLERSPSEDPYVELPALQVVADALWATRHLHPEPLSLEHYDSLPVLQQALAVVETPTSGASTPADWVLDHYLNKRLEGIEDQPDSALTDEDWRDLRIDCLYLLTDRTRHRRALPAKLLLEQLPAVRLPSPGLEVIDRSLLSQAMAPLVDLRLVSDYPLPEGEVEYELSHDFAVRAVVRNWREQDRRRASEAAVREQRISVLERRDLRAFGVLRALPLIGFPIVTVLLLLLADMWGPRPVSSLAWLGLSPFAVTLALGLLSRHTASPILASGVLLGLSTVALTAARHDEWPPDGVDQALAFMAAASTGFFLLFTVLWNALDIGRRLRESKLHRLTLSVMLAELIDFSVLAGVFAGILTLADLLNFDNSPWLLTSINGLALLSVTALSGWLVSRYGVSLGLKLSGLRAVAADGVPPTFQIAFVRAFLFIIWAAVCLAALLAPWLFVGPLVLRYTKPHRPLYDLITNTHLVERSQQSRDQGIAGGPSDASAAPRPAARLAGPD